MWNVLNFLHAKYNFGEKSDQDTFLTAFVRSTPLFVNNNLYTFCVKSRCESESQELIHKNFCWAKGKWRLSFSNKRGQMQKNANEEEKKKHTDPFHVISHWAVGKVWHRGGESVCVCVGVQRASLGAGRVFRDHTSPNHQGPKPRNRRGGDIKPG